LLLANVMMISIPVEVKMATHWENSISVQLRLGLS